jgi:hypothetical protein
MALPPAVFLDEALAELVLRIAWAIVRLVWELLWERYRPLPRADDDRVRAAHAFLARHASAVGQRDGRIVGRLRPDRGNAEVTIDEKRGRVRVACAWDGGGIVVAPFDPRSDRLPHLIAPLSRVGGIDVVSSNGRTLEIAGPLVLGSELEHATRKLAAIASSGRRMRERLAHEHGRTAPHVWSVDVTLAGARAVLSRSTAHEARFAFSLDATGHVTAESGAPPDSLLAALGGGPVRIEIANGRARASWPDVPSPAQLERVERALSTALHTSGPYR